MERETISCKDAKKKGARKYYTGKLCKHGHDSERWVSNRKCITCHRLWGVSDKKKEYMKGYYIKNRKRELARAKKYRENNLEKVKKYLKQYYEKHKNGSIKEYYENNKTYINRKSNENRRKRYSEDYNFKLKVVSQSILHRVLNQTGKDKKKRTNKLLGYSHIELKRSLESKFFNGMSWDNYGTEWNIDHIVPVSKLIDEGVEDPAEINSLDNLIPMWKPHNGNKHNKTLEEFLTDRPELVKLYGHFLK